MRVGVDLDGVVADYANSVSYFVSQYCPGMKCDWSRYDMGLPRNKLLSIYDAMIDTNRIVQMGAYPGASVWMGAIASEHEIHYITKRQPMSLDMTRKYNLESQTLQWLLQHRFPCWWNLHFTQNKPLTCVTLGIEVMLEDCLDEARGINGKRNSVGYTRCWLLDRPWNQGDYPRRVKSYGEIPEPFPRPKDYVP